MLVFLSQQMPQSEPPAQSAVVASQVSPTATPALGTPSYCTILFKLLDRPVAIVGDFVGLLVGALVGAQVLFHSGIVALVPHVSVSAHFPCSQAQSSSVQSASLLWELHLVSTQVKLKLSPFSSLFVVVRPDKSKIAVPPSIQSLFELL